MLNTNCISPKAQKSDIEPPKEKPTEPNPQIPERPPQRREEPPMKPEPKIPEAPPIKPKEPLVVPEPNIPEIKPQGSHFKIMRM
jgi:hypothetical protein